MRAKRPKVKCPYCRRKMDLKGITGHVHREHDPKVRTVEELRFV